MRASLRKLCGSVKKPAGQYSGIVPPVLCAFKIVGDLFVIHDLINPDPGGVHLRHPNEDGPITKALIL